MAYYTNAFKIPEGQWTGQANALTAGGLAGVGCIIIGVRLWADDPNGPVRYLAIRSGDVLNIKVRYVEYAALVAGVDYIVGLN
jgi:hypothetical protein